MQAAINKIRESCHCTSIVETCARALGIFCNINTSTVALIMWHTEKVNTGHYDYDVVTMTAKTDAMNSLMAI